MITGIPDRDRWQVARRADIDDGERVQGAAFGGMRPPSASGDQPRAPDGGGRLAGVQADQLLTCDEGVGGQVIGSTPRPPRRRSAVSVSAV